MVNVRGSPHQVDHACQHLGRLLPIVPFVSHPAYNVGLIVIAPEEGIPAASCLHTQLPLHKQLLQLFIIRNSQRPLVSVLVIYLQMMKVKAHGQLLFLRGGISDTVLKGSGRHFSHCHKIFYSCAAHQLFQVFVDMGAVCIKSAAVSL